MDFDRIEKPGRSEAEVPGRTAERREWLWTCDPTETWPTASGNGSRPWHSRVSDYATVIAWANLLGS